jgi:hypothetical protein
MAAPLSLHSLVARLLAAGLLLGCCLPGAAGIFKKNDPPPDWGMNAYKTKTPDYAKDAAAVILFDEFVETVDAQGRAVERERRAKRVLKPQGRGEVACSVAYSEDEKINYFRVWTIAADEKQYMAQDSDFFEEGDTGVPIMLSTTNGASPIRPRSTWAPPSSANLKKCSNPTSTRISGRFQQGIPVVFQALEVDLPPGRAHTQSWHNFSPVQPVEVAPNHWRWELKDMPALTLRDIPSRPEWYALQRACLSSGATPLWTELTTSGAPSANGSPRLKPTVLIHRRRLPRRRKRLIAGAPDFYTKLERITDFIQKNIRYFIVMRGIGGLQANHAADIFRNKYGDCKDKTTLLISMLQVAGIHAYYVPVDDRRGIVDPDDPSLFGNHMITAIEVPADVQDPRLMAIVKGKDGKRYLIFDPTNERTPVGNLPSYLQGGYGTLAAGASSQIIALPVLPPDANGTERKGSFTLRPTERWPARSIPRTRGRKARICACSSSTPMRRSGANIGRTRLRAMCPAWCSIRSSTFSPPRSTSRSSSTTSSLPSQYAHTAGTLLLVRPRVVGSDVLPFDDKPRTVSIDLNATGKWHDSFDITLPVGYVVDETPDPIDVDVDFASYHSTVTGKDNHLHYEREYVVRQVEIPRGQGGGVPEAGKRDSHG